MRIQITESTVAMPNEKPVRMWHWARYNEIGQQVDGSGAQRNGSRDLAKLTAMIDKKFPDDVVEGLGG